MRENKKYRHELKYIINCGYYEILRQRLRAALRPDIHGEKGVYRITSLYLDDVFHTAYNDKISGLDVRKKYRLRYYDMSDSVIKLEVKEKKGDFVCKESADITPEEYRRILKDDKSFLGEDRFIGTAGEAMFASDRLTRLTPAALVDYKREAYICPEGNVRLTFDSELQTAQGFDPLYEKTNFYRVFQNNEIVFEVKYDSFIPNYIQGLISGIPTTRESVSKYVLCRDHLKMLIK